MHMLGKIDRHLRAQQPPLAATATAADAEEPLRCIEQRTYYAAPGRLGALHCRFRDHTCALFEKHGLTNLGYFSPLADDSVDGTLAYFIAAPSRVERDVRFASFSSDPAWSGPDGARTQSETDGGLVERVESVFLEATEYSPPVGPLAREGQLLELRCYVAAEGKSGALTDETLADQFKQALVRPEHEVLRVLGAGGALEARLAPVLLVEGDLSGLRLELLLPLQRLVLQVGP